VRVQAADGSYVVSVRTIRGRDGKMDRVAPGTVCGKDIDERKRDEERLQMKTSRYVKNADKARMFEETLEHLPDLKVFSRAYPTSTE